MGLFDKLFGTDKPERKNPSQGLRNRIVAEQGRQCYRCRRKESFDCRLQYHHKRSVAGGGETSHRNGVLLCPTCHDLYSRRQNTRRAEVRRENQDNMFNFFYEPKSAEVRVRPKSTTTRKRKRKADDDIFGLGAMQKEFDSIFGAPKRRKRSDNYWF